MNMKMKGVFVAAMLLMPTAALAAPGMVTATVPMRAGPGPGFPMVDRIPGGSHVNIHGCIRGDAWCDVSWAGDRGWISSQYLEYLYRNRYVYLPDYTDVIDVPVVPFVLSSYWASYYSGRPWYHRRAYWNGYWRSHARFATQVPLDRSARFARTETRTAIREGRFHSGLTPGVARPQGFAHLRGAPSVHGGMAHVNAPGRTFSRIQQPMPMHRPMVRGQEAARFAAPVARPSMPSHVAQPHVGRVGGPPMGAHAQMGGVRPAPAMAGGGAPHINAAPRVGGGAPAGGPPGLRHR